MSLIKCQFVRWALGEHAIEVSGNFGLLKYEKTTTKNYAYCFPQNSTEYAENPQRSLRDEMLLVKCAMCYFPQITQNSEIGGRWF